MFNTVTSDLKTFMKLVLPYLKYSTGSSNYVYKPKRNRNVSIKIHGQYLKVFLNYDAGVQSDIMHMWEDKDIILPTPTKDLYSSFLNDKKYSRVDRFYGL